MKKNLAFLLALVICMSFPMTAHASGSTVISTDVPELVYTLNIPANSSVAYRATSHDIGNVTITDSIGFSEDHDVSVAVDFTPAFTSDTTDTIIPYALTLYKEREEASTLTKNLNPGDSLIFEGLADGAVNQYARIPNGAKYAYVSAPGGLRLSINSDDWRKASGGEYSTKLIFTSEVVTAS